MKSRKATFVKNSIVAIGTTAGVGACVGLLVALTLAIGHSLNHTTHHHSVSLAVKVAAYSAVALVEMLALWCVIAFVYFIVLGNKKW